MTQGQLEKLMSVGKTHTTLWFSVARTQPRGSCKGNVVRLMAGWKKAGTGIQVLERVQRRVYFFKSSWATP